MEFRQLVEEPNIVWHAPSITRAQREMLNGHHGCVIWFTGLSGCGKSTVANLVDNKLHGLGVHAVLLDGDNVRHGLNATPQLLSDGHGPEFAERFGLGFSAQDREENIRRIGAVAELFATDGIVTLTAFVSPYRRDRQAVRDRIESAGRTDDFIEVFVDAPLNVCEARDPKGLYKQARAGKIKGFTGIDDPYEPPKNPELHLDAAGQTPDELAEVVVAYLVAHEKIRG
jgi:adenylylsulfate kinase